jgi:hypothetical protein
MGESLRAGAADLPTAGAAGTVLTDARAGAVTDVEWRGRRRLPPDDLDVVVYRGTVERDRCEAYYVVLGAGLSRVLPARKFDAVDDVVAAVQAGRRGD